MTEPAVTTPPKMTAGELARELTVYAGGLESAKGTITLSARTTEGVLPATEHGIAFARPDKVYIESLGPMGEIAVVTRVAGGRMAVHYLADGVWAEGVATPENTARLLGVPVDIPLTVGALLAEPLIEAEGFDGTIRYVRPEAGDDPTRLAFRRADGTRALLITVDDSSPVPLEQVLYDAEGEPELRIAYSDYAPAGGVLRPYRIVIEDYAGSSVEITFSSQEVNPVLPEGIFELT
ncbi:hypothetical protein KAU45_01380, partial [bacterium]|nr:hypothetical protein [bacterium]